MEETNKHKCPLCGAENYVEPNLDEDIKDSFVEHVLAGIPFTRVYDEMGGRISVKVTTIPDDTVRVKGKLMVKLLTVSDYAYEVKARLPILEACMDTDCQVAAISIKDKNGNTNTSERVPGAGLSEIAKWDWDKLTSEQAVAQFDKAVEVLDNALFPTLALPKSILRAAVGKHNNILVKLMTECFDENFLGGTGRGY